MRSKYILTPGSLLYIYVQCIINIPLCKWAHVKYWMTFRYLKKYIRETQQMGLDSIFGPFIYGKQ